MPRTRPAARNVCIAARDTVDEPQRFEERERAVDLSGCRPPILPVESLHDLVGPCRLMFGQQNLKHRPPISVKRSCRSRQTSSARAMPSEMQALWSCRCAGNSGDSTGIKSPDIGEGGWNFDIDVIT